MAKGLQTHVTIKVVLGAIFVVSLAIVILAAYDRVSLRRAISEKMNELKVYRDQGLDVLNRERLNLEKQLKSLKDVNDRINKALFSSPKARMPKEAGDALKFKEELYKVQNKIKEEGGSIDFKFPFWLGFEKYEHNIPTPSELPVRVKQLDIIREIADLMLQSKVPELSSVEFLESKNVMYEGGKEPVYREFPVRISFRCKNDSLIGFMYKLYVSEIPFKIDMLKIVVSSEETAEKGDLKVELIAAAAIQPAEKI